MPELDEEKYVRELFARLYGTTLRKVSESRDTGAKTFDHELLAGGKRVAAIEVKRLGRVPRTPENGWKRDDSTGFMTRTDNGAARVGDAIHKAYKQLSTSTDTKMLVFVNDDSMDFLDLKEALDGYLIYGNEEVGYHKNIAGRKVAEGRIRDEKAMIDLYIWINRYEGRHPWRPSGLKSHEELGRPFFIFATDAGYQLARKVFNAPETPRPSTDPGTAVPTLNEFLLREQHRAKSARP
jgi:hypothetical protein